MTRKKDKKRNKIKDSLKKNQEKGFYTPLFSRFQAFIIDCFLITTPISYVVMYFILDGGDDFAKNRVLGWGLILGTTLLIICFFWYVKSQTPGMKACDLKIVNLKNERITIFQALIRYVSTLFSIFTLFFIFIPYFNKEKKTFQDFISKTTIIKQ